MSVRLKFQSCFPRRIRERFHSAVIFVVAAIESDHFDSCCRSFLGDQLADLRCGVGVAAIFHFTADRFIASTDADQGLAGQIIDDLTAKMLERSLNAHPRLLSSAPQFVSHMIATPLALLLDSFVFVHVTTDRKLTR